MAFHSVSPAVDHVRTVESLLIFDPVHPVHSIAIAQSDNAELVDVRISLHGERAPYFTLTTVPFFFPAGIHIYFAPSDRTLSEAVDLTPALTEAIRASLVAMPVQTFRAAYSEALNDLLKIEHTQALSSAMNPQILAADQARLASLIATPPQQLFSALGSRAFGLGGSLHPFNWLFSHISLPPISLAALLATVSSPPYSLELGAQVRPRLILSHGPLSDIGNSDPAIAGAVRLTLEAVFHNELEDEFDDLENKIRVALLEIQKKFRAGGPLMQAIANIDDATTHINADIANVTALVNSARAELATLLTETVEVKNRITALTPPTFPGIFPR